MKRLDKAVQRTLDELDCLWPAGEIAGHFLAKARAVIDHILVDRLPDACFDSIAQVATSLARHDCDGEMPTGYGSAIVMHFIRRSDQLKDELKISPEKSFALVELASRGAVVGQWADVTLRTTVDSYKQCIGDVVQLAGPSTIEQAHWRWAIAHVLRSPSCSIKLLRKVACALLWCGYLSPNRLATDPHVSSNRLVTDLQLAKQFKLDRPSFVRFRQDALDLLAMLAEGARSTQRSPTTLLSVATATDEVEALAASSRSRGLQGGLP